MNCLNVSAVCCIDRHGYVADSGGNSFCVRPGEASGPSVCHIPSRQQAPAPGARNVTREPQPLAGSGGQHVTRRSVRFVDGTAGPREAERLARARRAAFVCERVPPRLSFGHLGRVVVGVTVI